jgi:Rod binding domain-containing protein
MTNATQSIGAPANAPALHDPARMQHAAEDFTAVALGELLSPMFEAAQEQGPFDGGAAEKMWRPMLVQEIAKSIAQQGGFGLTEQVRAQMLRMQEGRG